MTGKYSAHPKKFRGCNYCLSQRKKLQVIVIVILCKHLDRCLAMSTVYGDEVDLLRNGIERSKITSRVPCQIQKTGSKC